MKGDDSGAGSLHASSSSPRSSAANLTETGDPGSCRPRTHQQPATVRSQVGVGDLLANVQDVEIEGLPSYIHKVNFTGGLRPSALGPMSRQAGDQPRAAGTRRRR